MSITEFHVRGRFVGYRVCRKAFNQHYQAYAMVHTEGGKREALNAAKRLDRAMARAHPYKRVVKHNGRLYGLTLYERWKDDGRQERGLKLQIYKNGQFLCNQCWTFGANEWEDAYEAAVKLIIQHRKLALTVELAQHFEQAKPLYDPTRKRNWQPC